MDKFLFLLSSTFLLLHLYLAVPDLTTDQTALLAFKTHLLNSSSNNVFLHSWSPHTSCCNWTGITCGSRHQRVTTLNLSYMGITSTIPPHLGNLSFITFLAIRNNSFFGELPYQLSFLRRLKIIDLRFNKLNGNLPFGKFPQLQRLRLSYNSFFGRIPSSIYNNMSSLQFLDLGDNGFSGGLPEDMCENFPLLDFLSLQSNQLEGQIPSNIQKCRRLKILSSSYNKFSGRIPKEIGNLTMLRKLYLGFNKLDGEIPREMANLASLNWLSLTNNTLSGSIPKEIGNLTMLTSLGLDYNELSGNIPKEIGDLTMLKELYLFNNKLSGSIPKEIGNLTMLTELYLGDNKLNGGIPHELGNLQNLQVLYLSDSSLSRPIPPTIFNISTLESISLSDNNLSGELPTIIGVGLRRMYLANNKLSGTIPPMIFNISTLEIIELSTNNLSGQLPPNIGVGIVNLKRLYLAKNKLSGTIPSSISNASMLNILELSFNSFTGSIPHSLGTLQFLTSLNLGNNSLTIDSSSQELRILTSLTSCRNLIHLQLSGNNFDASLPSSVGNFSNSLETLFVQDCNIKGHIPREIGNLSNLISLSLYSNRLSGSIPASVGKLQNLQGLRFAENNLEGHIPYDLCLLQGLAYLHLLENKLSGPIPTCINNLTSLVELRLNSNKLTSTIPSALGNLIDILILDLSSNSLSGTLPLQIGRLNAVTGIYISDNQLSGNIPPIIGYLQSLDLLSLAHNKLQGPIPSSFENLISLEFLDLSNNNLSGAIPMSLEKLKYLKFLNVSSNRLSKEIPNGGPFVNFSAKSCMLNDKLCGAPRFKVPPCKNNTSSRREIIVLVLKYVLPAIVIIVCVLIFLLVRWRKKSEMIPSQTESLPNALRRISYKEIVEATDGFNEYNLLGKGSFGNVYKAIFSDGKIFAIKVFNLQLEGAFKSFDVECEVLRNIRHRNLIKIISSCSNNHDFKALVLEYMPNGNLDKWLYSHNYYLDIMQRLNIMIDVALALEYLHHGYGTPIVHCDLKPSNILLDVDMVAHVGDFGISKLLGDGDFMKQTLTLATIGYMAPEYGSEGIVSIKGDVYSYGIMLMETFTRKKPTDEYFTNEMSLKSWVSDSLPDSVTEVVDYNLLRSEEEESLIANKHCISSVLTVALTCCADLPEERIDMKDVVARLVNIKKTSQVRSGRSEGKCRGKAGWYLSSSVEKPHKFPTSNSAPVF